MVGLLYSAGDSFFHLGPAVDGNGTSLCCELFMYTCCSTNILLLATIRMLIVLVINEPLIRLVWSLW